MSDKICSVCEFSFVVNLSQFISDYLYIFNINNIFLYSITYISGEDAAAYQSSRVGEQSPPPPTMMPSQIYKIVTDSDLFMLTNIFFNKWLIPNVKILWNMEL